MEIGDNVNLKNIGIQECHALKNTKILEIKNDNYRVGRSNNEPSIWVHENNIDLR